MRSRQTPTGGGKATAGITAKRTAGPWSATTGSQEGSADALYRLLVETVRDYAIFALDAEGRVLTWNSGAQRIKGYAASEIIGRHFSVFYPPEKIASGHPAMELEVATREGRFEEEGWRVRKDGTQFWANVVITALHDPEGHLVGFAKVTRDLTERREAEQRALADAKRVAQVEAANRAKSEFLATMSHELRTPLNAIGGYADLLLGDVRGPLTPTQREDLVRIRRSQQHLLGIINDLLNFGRIEAGRITYQVVDVPLGEVAAAIVPMVEPQAAERGVAIEIGACGADIVAQADRAKVEQVVLNLLSNAIKFTPAGGTISTACSRDGERVYLDVRDSGVGIPADKQEAIFEPFVQLTRTLTTGLEGTGLGLSISRDLARAMGGDLTVESEPGTGSRFRLALPGG